MKHCLKCNYEIEKDDNFCPNCGHWTPKGYTYLQDNNITDGKIIKQKNRMANLFLLLVIFLITAIGICIIRGKDILQPFIYIKRQTINYQYNYNTTIIKTDNQYINLDLKNNKDAITKIKEDFNEQKWQCKSNIEITKIENELQDNYNIPSVCFCEISLSETKKISNTIKKIYTLFPNIKGYLTNISITNSNKKNNYVAYFQPIYQFVNSTSDNYTKVNKTQILLNSYYFLNDNTLNNPVKENWYVKDANWESLIAHEFGHYITYVSLLKNKNISNLTLITKNNENIEKEIIDTINNQTYSKEIIMTSINNYNKKYNKNITIEEYAKSISNYATIKDSMQEYIYDEIIAEAVHDYYLHNNNAKEESLEIISALKSKLK